MLFYYFKNKLELYNFLIDYSFACWQDYFAKINNLEEGDLIEKYRLINKYKMEAYNKYPLEFEFIKRLYIHEDEAALPEESKKQYENLMAERRHAFESINATVDISLFRTDIGAEKIIKYINWSMDGYLQYIISNVQTGKLSDMDMDALLNEYDEYLNDLKTLFYK